MVEDYGNINLYGDSYRVWITHLNNVLFRSGIEAVAIRL